MSSLGISTILFACILGGNLLGMILRAVLPQQHLSADTKDVVKVTIALIATMAALVIGLLISSAKSAYDTRNNEILQTAANIVMLDSTLAHYGPETKDIRLLLRVSTAAAIERIWPANGAQPAGVDRTASPAETLYNRISELTPNSDVQRVFQVQAMQITIDIGHTRFLLVQQASSSIPIAFLVIVVFWLTIIFASFGLYAPPNAMLIAVFLVGALSISAAIFLILDLDRSFEGAIKVSSTPLRQALARLSE